MKYLREREQKTGGTKDVVNEEVDLHVDTCWSRDGIGPSPTSVNGMAHAIFSIHAAEMRPDGHPNLTSHNKSVKRRRFSLHEADVRSIISVRTFHVCCGPDGETYASNACSSAHPYASNALICWAAPFASTEVPS